MDALIEQNPYLDGEFFAAVRDEATCGPDALQVEGTIPRDFGGIYLRPFTDYPDGASEFDRMLHKHRINAHLQRYRFHLTSGSTTEQAVTGDIGEFGMINTRHIGRPTRYVYGNGFDYDEVPVRFLSLMRWDPQARSTDAFDFGADYNGSEPQFCARDGATDEDDGYVVTFLHNQASGQGECWLFDARQIAAGPLAKIYIPQRLPAGFHGIWVPPAYLGDR